MAETGTLLDRPVAVIFRDLARSRRGGVLRLSQGRTIRVVIFDEGRPAFALSNVPEEQLDVLLVRQRRLKPDQAAEAKSQIKKEFELGHKLVELGMIDQETMRAATAEQSRNVVVAAFAMREGEYNLDTAARASYDVSIDVPSGRLVMDAARETSVDVAREILDAAGPFVTASGRQLDGADVSSVDGYLLSRITSPMMPGEICDSSGLPEEQVLPALYALFAAGFVERAIGDSEQDDSSEGSLSVDELRAEVDHLIESYETADHYEVLGVERTANIADVKKAYYALAKKLHPDRYRSVSDPDVHDKLEVIFARISRAYDILKDSRLRADYDARLGPPKVPPPISQPPPKPVAPPPLVARPVTAPPPVVERPPSGPTGPMPRPPSTSMPTTPRPSSGSMTAAPRPQTNPMPATPRPQTNPMPAATRPPSGSMPAATPPQSPPPADAAPLPDTQSAVYDDAQRAEQMYREGLRRFENKDLMGAIQVWRDAVRLAPTNGEYNKRLGLALARNQRWHKEAEKHLLAAAKAETLNPEITNALGHVYLEAGLKKRAEAQFRKVLAYNPGNRDAIKGLEELGIEYSFLSNKDAKGAAGDGSTSRGSFLSKPGSGKGDGSKEGVDPKLVVAIVVILIVIIVIYAMWVGLI